jgi:hypothetical protein
MKYGLALVILCLPAMLAAKGSCQMPEKSQAKAGTSFSLTVGWRTSPLLAEHVL